MTVWDPEATRRVGRRFSFGAGNGTCGANPCYVVAPRGDVMAASRGDGTVTLVDLRTRRRIADLPGARRDVGGGDGLHVRRPAARDRRQRGHRHDPRRPLARGRAPAALPGTGLRGGVLARRPAARGAAQARGGGRVDGRGPRAALEHARVRQDGRRRSPASWRSRATAVSWSPRRAARPSSPGTPARASSGCGSPLRTRPTPSPSRPTRGSSPPAPRTAGSGCGTSAPAGPAAPRSRSRAPTSPSSPSRRTAACSPSARSTARRRSGTCARGRASATRSRS